MLKQKIQICNKIMEKIKNILLKLILFLLFKSFQDSNKAFLVALANLEKFLASYLNVIFIKTKKTHDGLHILAKYSKKKTKILKLYY